MVLKNVEQFLSSYDLDPKVYRGVIAPSLIKKGAVDMDEYETNCPKNIYGILVPMIAIAISLKKPLIK